MEKKKKLSIGASLVVILLGFVSCNQTSKNPEKELVKEEFEYYTPVFETMMVDRLIPIQLTYTNTVKVLAIKGGNVKKGDVSWKNGHYVKKGQLLVQLSFESEYAELSALKKQLHEAVSTFLQTPEIANSKMLVNKWQAFLDELSPAKRLPAFPLIDSEEEKQALKQTLIGKYYVRANALETTIEQAFVFAPKSGWLMNIRSAIGDEVSQGKVLAEIVQKNDWRIKNTTVIDTISGDKWKLLSNKKEMGTLFRLLSKKNRNYQLELIDGTDLNQMSKLFIQTHQTIRTARIPATIFNKNSLTYIEDKKEKIVQVDVVKRTRDSLWVTGLPEIKKLRLIMRK